MRLLKIIAALLFFSVVVFAIHTTTSTGFFRKIEPHFDGQILKRISLKGAEDITISYVDSFALISSTNRLGFPPKEEEKGGLYLMDLKTKNYKPALLTNLFNKPFAPHGISFFKKESSYIVMAINHTLQGHSIEVFELYDKKLNHIKTLKDASMISPNDLVMLDEKRFYFTNDHGYTKGLRKLLEEYGGLSVSNVVYFDGTNYKEVAGDIVFANGINFDRKRDLIFVASPRRFLVKVYQKNEDHSLSFIEDIPCGTGVDNIELDEEGNLWLGAHPNLLKFKVYSEGKKETAPSEIIKITYKGKSDYTIEKIYVEDGTEMSGSSVAATFGNLIFTGNVMDDEFLILQRSKKY